MKKMSNLDQIAADPYSQDMRMDDLTQADILIDLQRQLLMMPKKNLSFQVSTGLNGIGEQENSGKTPRGWHRIAQKIGDDMPSHAVFKARQWTGEIYNAQLAAEYPGRDWILTRILWLDGLEAGFNQGEGCDTFSRYIYIHGTPESEPLGIAQSHGCVRMHSADLLQLYALVQPGDLVYLSEHVLD